MIKFYFHDAVSTVGGTLPSGQKGLYSTSVVVAGATTNRSMNDTPGTGPPVSVTWNTLAQTSLQPTMIRKYVSPPLAAQTVAVGSWALAMAGAENSANSNLQFALVLYFWRPSNGTMVGTQLFDANSSTMLTTEPGLTATWVTATASPAASRTLLDGDVLVVEVWRSTVGQSMGTLYTNEFDYDGTTETSTTTPASFISAPADIPVLPDPPTGLTGTVISGSEIDLSWGSVASATNYLLERSLDGATGWTTAYSGATNSFNDTSLASSTIYYYRVSVTVGGLTSPPSASINRTTSFVMPFTEDFSGGSWARWATDVSFGVPSAGFSVVGGAGLMKSSQSGVGGSDHATVIGATNSTDQGLLLTFTPVFSVSTTILVVVLRGDGVWSGSLASTTFIRPLNGYYLKLQTAGSALYKSITTTETALTTAGSISNPVSTEQWKARFEVIGTTLQARAWKATNSEPSTWLSATDSARTTGVLQLAAYLSDASGADTVTVDDISWYVPTSGPSGAASVVFTATGTAQAPVSGAAAVTFTATGAVLLPAAPKPAWAYRTQSNRHHHRARARFPG